MTIPTIALLVQDRFSPFHLSIPQMVFSHALHDQQPLFDLRLCAVEKGPLRSGPFMTIEPPHQLAELEQADIVIIPYWRDPAELPPAALLASLRKAHDRGARIAGLCMGAYVIAQTGLLDGKRAATHWELERDFQSRFPDVRLDMNKLYVEEGQIITSAGTGAALDCCLYLVRQIHGSATANKIARRMVVPSQREGGQAQFIETPVPISPSDSRMKALIDTLRADLAASHSLDALAQSSHMSRRTFTRRFQKATGQSVGDWLLSERLRQSQVLLETTTHTMEQIADLVGFRSASSLRQHFRTRFGVTPSAWRQSFGAHPRGA